jgi:CxxC-x17-CxxC domain-containing protein
MSFTDKTVTCRDCSTQFIFTTGEQEFYAQKGFTNEPTRCPSCRQANKANRNGGSSRGGQGYSSDRGNREMFSVRCSECGNEAQVPFQPRGDKPVYCSDCFRSQRQSSGGGGSYGGNNRW